MKATIPMLYAFDHQEAAFAFCRPAGVPRLTVMLDGHPADVGVWEVIPKKAVAERRADFVRLPNGNYQDSNGTQYVVVKFCEECRDWKGVDLFFRFTHEAHVRRTA